MRRLHGFLEEMDEEWIHHLHRRRAQEMAARMSLSSGRDSADGSEDVSSRQTVSRARRPVRGAGSSCASDMVSLSPAEAYTVQALMDLALPRFAGLGYGPRQVHVPWAMSTDSPASPATSRLDTSGEEDRVGLGSPCLDLDGLSSSDDDIGTLSHGSVHYSYRMDQIAGCLVVTFWMATMIGLRRKNILTYLTPDDHMMGMWQKNYVLRVDIWKKQWSGCSQTLQITARSSNSIGHRLRRSLLGTWTVCPPRLQSGMWWTIAAFGRATPIRLFAGLVSLVRIRPIQPMLSEMPTGPVGPQGWRQSPDRDRARINWRIYFVGY